MNFILKPSLEHMALVNIVTRFWNQNDVRSLIPARPMFLHESNKEWKYIEEKVTEKVLQLLLPQHLKSKLANIIKPTGVQILEWLRKHERGFHLRVDLPAAFNWTPQGTVDRKRTAEVLVKDENLDISTRYELACIYCLEDDIQKLWHSMAENVKQSFFHKEFPNENSLPKIVYFWTQKMDKTGFKNRDIYSDSVFQFDANIGNKAVAEYFLPKLDPEERRVLLVIAAKVVKEPDVLCFLLSKMNEEQQMEVFKKYPTELKRFLKWPLQCLFIEMADRMWGFLSKQHHNCLLLGIISKIQEGYRDWNYKKLFGEFWRKSPNALKSFNTGEFNNFDHVLYSLLITEDKENLKLILKDVTIAEKINFFSDRGQVVCSKLIYYNKWDMLEFFIKECLPSEDEMMKFKEKFEKHIKETSRPGRGIKSNIVRNKHKWYQLFGLSDDSAFFL